MARTSSKGKKSSSPRGSRRSARPAKKGRKPAPNRVIRTGSQPLIKGRIHYEVRGIAVVLALSLLSADGRGTPNWIGPFGDAFAGWSFQAFGLMAYALPALLLAWALPWLRGVARQGAHLRLRLWGALGAVAACMLLSGAVGMISLKAMEVSSGGAVGAFLHGGLASLLGGLGARVVSGTLLLIAVVVLSRRSAMEVLHLSTAWMGPVSRWVLDGIRRLGGRFRAFCMALPGRVREAAAATWAGLQGLREHGDFDAGRRMVQTDELLLGGRARSEEQARDVDSEIDAGREEEAPVAEDSPPAAAETSPDTPDAEASADEPIALGPVAEEQAPSIDSVDMFDELTGFDSPPIVRLGTKVERAPALSPVADEAAAGTEGEDDPEMDLPNAVTPDEPDAPGDAEQDEGDPEPAAEAAAPEAEGSTEDDWAADPDPAGDGAEAASDSASDSEDEVIEGDYEDAPEGDELEAAAESADGKPMVAERVKEEEVRDSLVPVVADDWELPSLDLLQMPDPDQQDQEAEDELMDRADRLQAALESYGVKGRVVGIHPGPVVTRFDFEPARGVKVSRIMGLADDLSLALASPGAVRVGGVIPGMSAVGIEVPNEKREIVYLREVAKSKAFDTEKFKLPAALGRDIEGRSVAVDLARTPHLLVAGATGMGKSVTVNSILISLLMSRTPAELRLILIDPKMLEFRIYDGIAHLLVPVVTDPRKSATALRWAVNEMNRRYRILSRVGVRNIDGFNKRVDDYLSRIEDDPDMVPTLDLDEDEPTAPTAPVDEIFNEGRIWDDDGTDLGAIERMPFIVIVIDELADLMMVAKKEVEESVVRLAQMARAAGIHMLLATQRPSVDVITGLIKANMPSRLSCRVTSKTDSRTILDANGAEHLLGKGDMLLLSPGQRGLKRVHGCFVSDEEVGRITEHLRSQGEPEYEDSVLTGGSVLGGDDGEDDDDLDDMLLRAMEIVVRTQRASASGLQTRLGIGYPRAARIVEDLHERGVVGPPNGSKARKVLIKPHEMEERFGDRLAELN